MFNNDKKKLTVCYFGTYTSEYSRNSTLISGLKKNEVDVVECKTIRRGFLKYIDLIVKHWKIRNSYDIMIVGFQGIQAVILAKLLTRKTIIFDAFASIYDSMVMDRKSVKVNSFVAKYYWWLDKISMILADIVLFETNENIDYASKEFGIKKEKFRRIFVGSDTDVFIPLKNKMCEVYAFDISQEAIDAQNNSGVIAERKNISLDDFNITDTYDAVILSEILEHLPLPELLMKKIKGKANFFLVSIPNSAFYKFRLRLLFGRFFKQWIFHPSEHLRFWSHCDFLDWVDCMGFDLVKYEASNGFDVGLLKFYKYMPNLFGHQICYLLKTKIK